MSVTAFVSLMLLVWHQKESSPLKILSSHFQVLPVGAHPGVNPGKPRKLIVEMIVCLCVGACFMFFFYINLHFYPAIKS